jgi:hypothetical protein
MRKLQEMIGFNINHMVVVPKSASPVAWRAMSFIPQESDNGNGIAPVWKPKTSAYNPQCITTMIWTIFDVNQDQS